MSESESYGEDEDPLLYVFYESIVSAVYVRGLKSIQKNVLSNCTALIKMSIPISEEEILFVVVKNRQILHFH